MQRKFLEGDGSSKRISKVQTLLEGDGSSKRISKVQTYYFEGNGISDLIVI